jgi:hypothetical protein
MKNPNPIEELLEMGNGILNPALLAFGCFFNQIGQEQFYLLFRLRDMCSGHASFDTVRFSEGSQRLVPT